MRRGTITTWDPPDALQLPMWHRSYEIVATCDGGCTAKELDARHKREARRFRADELRMGLATLARTYQEELVVTADPSAAIAAIDAVHAAAENVGRNANEELLLLALALQLPSLG